MARYDVIERQFTGLAAAVLAGVGVADEDFSPGQLDSRARPADQVLQANDGRRAVVGSRSPNQLMVVLEHFGPLAEHQPEGPRQVAHVEGLIVLIENQDHAVHGRIVSEEGPASAPRPRARRPAPRPVPRRPAHK